MLNEVKKPKKPVLYYYVIVILILILVNSLVMPYIAKRQIKEVEYSQFLQMTDQGEVGKVEINEQENKIGRAHV